jgi:RHS repeat-associated protein
MASTSVPCEGRYTAITGTDGTLRFMVTAASGQMYEPLVWSDTSTPLAGASGIGFAGPGGGALVHIGQARLYPIDRVAPSAIPASSVQTYVQSTEVDIRSGGSMDDENGVGLYQYEWYRDGQLIGATFNPEYVDLTVSAGSTHTYGVTALDYDGNASSTTSFAVVTPSTSSIDPRGIGLRANGSYWGGMGEQIDVRSGNLNYSYPLITAQSRGLSVLLSLSYNSQNWRQDSSGNSWNLGMDTGYGYGWLLQFGSITPFYSSEWDVAFYQFRDSSGAVYRLDQNNNGIWTSKDSVYVSFDDQTDILHFNDGSQWGMWNTSGGLEQDAGTMYPLYIEDSNGNQVWAIYDWSNGWGSSRIVQIYDARSSTSETYDINYDQNGYPSSITNTIGSGESFNLAYNSPVTLTSPYSPNPQFSSVETIASITNATTDLATTFAYDPSNDGELTQVTFAYGGHIRWQYGATNYAQGTLRGVQNRYLLWDNSVGERTFSFARTLDAASDAAATSKLTYSQAQAGKKWTFVVLQDATQGLPTIYQQFRTSDATVLDQVNYTWAQDPAGRNYIARTQDIANPSTAYSATKQTDQVMDQYGNVTQTKLYAYGNLSTPAKTYTNTYLSDPNYTSLYIYNRLLTSTVTDANGNVLPLVTNTYDDSELTDAPNAWVLDPNYDVNFYYRGNVTSSTSFAQVSYTEYDITGSIVYSDDGNTNHGVTITNSSDADYAAPSAITTANSMTTSFTWNSVLAPLTTTGPNGDTAAASYDSSSSRPTSSTSPYGAVTTYTYSNTAPQIVSTVNGAWTQTYLDGLGRPSRIARGNGSTTLSYADTIYDTCGCTPMGKPFKKSLPYAPGATPAWKTNTYDALGRTLTTVAADGSSTTTYTYQGATLQVTDAAGKWKQYVTDAFGQLTQVIEQSPNPATEPNHVTNYSYDILGRLIQVQMPRTVAGQVITQIRTWTYDPSTQLLAQTNSPEAGVTQYAYNSDGTLASRTDAKNQQIQYTYDPFGRVTQVSRGTLVNGQFNEDLTQRATLTYDDTDNGFSENTIGRVSEVDYSGPHGLEFSEFYSYHEAGALTGKRLSVSGTALGTNTANLDAAFTYNNLGQISSMQYPFAQWSNGSVVTAGPQYVYTYDGMNRLGGMTGPNNQTLVSSVTYNAANRITQLNTSTFNETTTYNANMQVTGIVSGAYHYTYQYSATQNNGRILSETDVASGETITYQYDSLNRLIQGSGTGNPQGAWTQTFAFDGFGNLTQKTGSNAPSNAFLATNPATNQLTSNGAQYDGNGNLTAYGTGSFAVSYAYDIENRLSSALPAGTVETLFGYDYGNQRVYQGSYNTSALTYSNEQIYFYGPNSKKLGAWSLSSSGGTYTLTATATNIWFAGRILTPKDRRRSAGKYFPFGEDRANPNPANPANDKEKFAKYTRDSATGLDYAYQRYYNSQLGRFHTPDPFSASQRLATPQSWNRFSYASDDPVNRIDPNGTCDSGVEWGGEYDVTVSECLDDIGLVSYFPVSYNPGSNSGGGGTVGTSPPTAPAAPTNPATTNNPCRPGSHAAVTASSLQTYLKGKNNGALASDANDFYNAGVEYGIDPRFLIALAGVETSFGKNITMGANNVFNWIYNGKNSSYTSVSDAIYAVAKGISNNKPYANASTPDQVYHVYCNFASDPSCAGGLKNLDTFMQQEGGTGSENRAFPCTPNAPVQTTPILPKPGGPVNARLQRRIVRTKDAHLA